MSSIKLPLGQNATWPEVAARLQLSSSCSHDWVRLSMRWKVQMTPRLDLEQRKHECRKKISNKEKSLLKDKPSLRLLSLSNGSCWFQDQWKTSSISFAYLYRLLIVSPVFDDASNFFLEILIGTQWSFRTAHWPLQVYHPSFWSIMDHTWYDIWFIISSSFNTSFEKQDTLLTLQAAALFFGL